MLYNMLVPRDIFSFLFKKKKTTLWSKVGKTLHVTSPPFKTDSISLLLERDSGKAASVYLLIFPKLIWQGNPFSKEHL